MRIILKKIRPLEIYFKKIHKACNAIVCVAKILSIDRERQYVLQIK